MRSALYLFFAISSKSTSTLSTPAMNVTLIQTLFQCENSTVDRVILIIEVIQNCFNATEKYSRSIFKLYCRLQHSLPPLPIGFHGKETTIFSSCSFGNLEAIPPSFANKEAWLLKSTHSFVPAILLLFVHIDSSGISVCMF